MNIRAQEIRMEIMTWAFFFFGIAAVQFIVQTGKPLCFSHRALTSPPQFCPSPRFSYDIFSLFNSLLHIRYGLVVVH
jgi:hypothetical protein